jgi:hypothetical protein
MLRTKANVDRAGPSQQLVLLKVLMKSKPEHSCLSLSNNLLTATKKITVAAVDGLQVLLNTSKSTLLKLKKNTPILEDLEYAMLIQRRDTKSEVIIMLLQTMPIR